MDVEASENREANGRYAVVTVCTPAFLPGTAVMLASFLAHNPWFEGDVIALTDEVPNAMRETLRDIYPVVFRPVSDRILRHGEAVRRAVTDRAILPVRFFAMELFAVAGYDRLLYLDSDVLVRADLRPFLLRDEPFVAVGDGFHYRNKLRSGPDYRPHRLRWWQRRGDYWSGLFNAGVVSLDGALANPPTFHALTDLIAPAYFAHGIKRFHNQKLLNIYFKGRATLVSGKWNYRLGMAEHILARDAVTLDDAAVVHYTAKRKPWMAEQAAGRLEAGGDYQKAYDWWQGRWQALPAELRARIEVATTPYAPTAAKPPRP